MARARTTYYDPVSASYVTRAKRRRKSRTSGLGTLGSFGQAPGLKGTLKSVQGVLITGAIATAGAVVTDQVYERLGESLKLEGWKRDVAKMATGIVLGILIAKFLKKPRLAAAFAIGPIVHSGLSLFGELMSGQTSGLGLTAFDTVSNPYSSMYSPLYGANKSLGAVDTFTPVRQEAADVFMPQVASGPATLNSQYMAMPAAI